MLAVTVVLARGAMQFITGQRPVGYPSTPSAPTPFNPGNGLLVWSG